MMYNQLKILFQEFHNGNISDVNLKEILLNMRNEIIRKRTQLTIDDLKCYPLLILCDESDDMCWKESLRFCMKIIKGEEQYGYSMWISVESENDFIDKLKELYEIYLYYKSHNYITKSHFEFIDSLSRLIDKSSEFLYSIFLERLIILFEGLPICSSVEQEYDYNIITEYANEVISHTHIIKTLDSLFNVLFEKLVFITIKYVNGEISIIL